MIFDEYLLETRRAAAAATDTASDPSDTPAASDVRQAADALETTETGRAHATTPIAPAVDSGSAGYSGPAEQATPETPPVLSPPSPNLAPDRTPNAAPDPSPGPMPAPATSSAPSPSPAPAPNPVPEGIALPPAPPRAGPDADVGPRRVFGDSGYEVRGPFLSFYEHFGPTLCGAPISGELLMDGIRTQLFERLALQEHAPGRVRPRDLGSDWLRMARALHGENGTSGPRADLAVVDLIDTLPSKQGGYPRRPLADIRYVAIHHTGAPAEVTPHDIAREHVEAHGWPGIGYHFVVGIDGTVWQTQDLSAVSHHVRQFNPVAVGIALSGDFAHASPSPVQLSRTAMLIARVLDDLGLPPEVVRGHGELVQTPCPGPRFYADWKRRLLSEVAIAGRPTARR